MLVSAIHQHESAIGIHISPPSWTSLPPPTTSHPSILSQSTRLSSLSKVLYLLKFKGKVHLNKHVYLKHGFSLLPAPSHCNPFWDQSLKLFLPLCLLPSCLISHLSCALEVFSELCDRGPDPFIVTCSSPCECPTLDALILKAALHHRYDSPCLFLLDFFFPCFYLPLSMVTVFPGLSDCFSPSSTILS